MFELASLGNARKKYLCNTVRVHDFYDIHYVIEYFCSVLQREVISIPPILRKAALELQTYISIVRLRTRLYFLAIVIILCVNVVCNV